MYPLIIIVRFEHDTNFRDSRSFENYPLLLNSEPNFYNDILEDSPSFVDRLYSIMRIVKIASVFSQFRKFSPVDLQSAFALFEMNFLLDHPALSFPALPPPNLKYLGFFSLDDYRPKPLPLLIMAFLKNCQDKPTILVSFGSFLIKSDQLWFMDTILNALMQTNACILLKSKEYLQSKFSLPEDKFYVKDWLPQKDLLASGQGCVFLVSLW